MEPVKLKELHRALAQQGLRAGDMVPQLMSPTNIVVHTLGTTLGIPIDLDKAFKFEEDGVVPVGSIIFVQPS